MMSYIDRSRRRRRSPRTIYVFHYRDKTINFVFAQREADSKKEKTNERTHTIFSVVLFISFSTHVNTRTAFSKRSIFFFVLCMRLPFRQPAPTFYAGPISV